MTTIKDVAKHAGVSITSASYAINSTGSISAATRKRVLEAAEALNYHPNAFARNLKNPKTLTIGVFITRFGGSFYEEILEGIHDVLLKTDYELIVCPESRQVRKVLAHRQVDGAIVFDTKVKSETILRLASKRYPIIVMDRHLVGEHLLSLLVDNQQGTRAAFYHLFSQGIRRIDFVSGAADSFDARERKLCFLREAKKNQVQTRCHEGNFTEQSGFEAGARMIDSGDLPEAVFCANDQMAIGLIRAMKERGVRVPADVAVVGFDDIQVARYIQPALTTVGASRFGWGAEAANQLIGYLEHETPFQVFRIPTSLIERESSIKYDHASPRSHPTPN
jgi:LacI family transcriptional regulator